MTSVNASPFINDPDEFLLARGKDAYLKLIADANDLSGARYEAKLILGTAGDSDRDRDQVLEALSDLHISLTDARDRETVMQEAMAIGFTHEMLEEFLAERTASAQRQRLAKDLPRLLERAKKELSMGAIQPTSLIPRLSRELDEMMPVIAEDEPPFNVDAMLAEVKSAPRGKPTGFPALDAKRIAINPQELALVAARTGHGKTTFLVNLLLNWLEAYPDELFLFYSYEVPLQALFLKNLCAMTGKSGGARWSFNEAKEWLSGDKTRDTYPDEYSLNEAITRLRGYEERFLPIYRTDWNADNLANHALRIAKSGVKIGGIFVDYMQIVPPPAGEHERRDIAITQTTLTLKRLAGNINAPVIAAAQFNRDAAKDGGPIPEGRLDDEKVIKAIRKRRPEAHHLRDGGGEQQPDQIFALLNYAADYSDEADNPKLDSDKPTPLELFVIKNRYGDRPVCMLGLDEKTGAIVEKNDKGKK